MANQGRRLCDMINVELSEEDILKMSMEEKINCLLKIAFMNRNTLADHDKIFYGNGKKGLVPLMQGHGYYLAGLWATVIGGGGILIAVVVNHISK